ncbi:hypothetical protein WR25_25530 [Diploscapter pachys]|uniref:Cystatin domain-containing protein n=1 Tax=Diploscapter pachys TaxID=2018661 RepID=A0A2A2JFX6_9BILA|nr:hypothetical protein WR25_25530 [Diploscapter pachys]
MQKAVLVAFVAACAVAFPVKRDTHVHDGDEENEMMGLAWHAAAGEINEGRHGKYLVPTKLVSYNTNGNIITIEAIYQESWCSTEEGHNLEDVCEEMCPIYQ